MSDLSAADFLELDFDRQPARPIVVVPPITSRAPAPPAVPATNIFNAIPVVAPAIPVVAPVVAVVAPVVAGAVVTEFGAANGALVGWSGAGEITRARLLAVLAREGIADLAPQPKSAHAHAGAAVRVIAGTRYVVRAERRGKSDAATPYQARWIISAVASRGDVGDSSGTIVATITLNTTNVLISEGSGNVGGSVVRAYQESVAGEIYSAGDVSLWLSDVLYRAGAVRLAGSYYVPAPGVATATALVTALRGVWGRGWPAAPIPVTSTAALATAITDAIAEEIAALEADLGALVSAAEESGKFVGAKSARTITDRAEALADRARLYQTLLTQAQIERLQAAVGVVRRRCNASVDPSSARFAAMDLT